MRTIKFRVWDKKNKEMNFTDIASLHQGSAVKFNLMTPWRKNIFCDEWELMQYTGLKDKNGKEIYEGDIILCDSPRRCPHQIIWTEVQTGSVLGGGMPGFYLSRMNDGYVFLGGEEVIGNIYENENLLK